MKLSEVFKISMTFIGTIIGAGFASGKEISLYFGTLSPLTPVLAGLFLGLFAFFFAELGRLSGDDADILGLLFKGVQKPVRKFIELANYITFVAMIAGAELVLFESFSVAGGGIFSALLAFSILLKGNDGMKILNALLVPVIIIAVTGLSVNAPTTPPPTKFSVLPPLAYASMNLLTGGYLVGGLTKRCSKSENVLIGMAVGLLSAALLFLLYRVVLTAPDAPMPVGAFAKSLNLGFVSGVLIYLAILTTMVSSLKVSSGGKAIKSLLAIGVGFLLSLAGFEALVDNFYPIIGYAGIALTAFAAAFLFKKGVLDKFTKKKTPTSAVGVSIKIKARKNGKAKPLFH